MPGGKKRASVRFALQASVRFPLGRAHSTEQARRFPLPHSCDSHCTGISPEQPNRAARTAAERVAASRFRLSACVVSCRVTFA